MKNPPKRFRQFAFCMILVVLCGMAVMYLLCSPDLNDWMSPKTFWRKDHEKIVKYHIRDYHVPWSRQLLAAIAIARKQGEHLYLEDTSPTAFARNRGNVKTVNLSEAELAALCRISGFLTENCVPDVQPMFPAAAIADDAKRLLDDVLARHPRLFYAHYLLGVWYREQGDDSATACFDKAFELSDCVIMCPIMVLNEHSGEVVPVVETQFPFGVTTNHRSDQWGDFTLLYPAVATDQHGLICLPVYREMISDPALEAVDANGTRKTVENFGLRDVARPYRFGLYVPVVLSDKQHSRLTRLPGFEKELRYVKRRVFANISLEDAEALGNLGIMFEEPNRLHANEGYVLMPTVRFADEFGDLYFRGMSLTELARQLQQYRDENAGQTSSLTITDGDNFIVSYEDGRMWLCRFLMSNNPQQSGVFDIWNLRCRVRNSSQITASF